jgi:peptidoglycan/LPS O-acetylase OafA/YrhL
METKKFGQLDALRVFSALFVLVNHWGWSHYYLIGKVFTGARGVSMFFVISGFLITLGLIKSKYKQENVGITLYKFYIRRSLRIFPIYYLTLLIIWYFDHAKVADSIWWNIFYLSNFYNLKIKDWGGMSHLWSLAVEEQFYLLWPFIILFTSRRFLPYVIGFAILLSECAKLYWFIKGSQYWWYEYMHPLGTLDSLAIGALLSYFFYFHQDHLKRFLSHWGVVAVVFASAVLAQILSQDYLYLTDRLFMGIFFAWLIGRSTFVFGGIWGFILNLKPLQYVGKISYCIYLIHPFIPELLVRVTHPHNTDHRVYLYTAVTIALASLSWYIFEKPILSLKERFI